jgi:nucleotide-binding universal stress UspA family protein
MGLFKCNNQKKSSMKTIIAGTDFSKSSINACKYAAMLANRLKCRLTIFNLFEVPLFHSNIGIYAINYDNMRKTSEKKMNKLMEEIHGLFPGIAIDAFITNGSFAEELKLFLKTHRVEAAVMGLDSRTRLSRFIYGSHGVSIAGKIDAPVIIVPDNYKEHTLKHVLLAVDNREKLHKSSLKGLENMLAGTKSKIQALHVRTEAEVLEPAPIRFSMNGKPMPVQMRRAKNLSNGLRNYCREKPADLIAIISKKHSAFYNFFAETHTKKLIFSARVPVLAIHE